DDGAQARRRDREVGARERVARAERRPAAEDQQRALAHRRLEHDVAQPLAALRLEGARGRDRAEVGALRRAPGGRAGRQAARGEARLEVARGRRGGGGRVHRPVPFTGWVTPSTTTPGRNSMHTFGPGSTL